jgi:hypothetical protein
MTWIIWGLLVWAAAVAIFVAVDLIVAIAGREKQ